MVYRVVCTTVAVTAAVVTVAYTDFSRLYLNRAPLCCAVPTEIVLASRAPGAVAAGGRGNAASALAHGVSTVENCVAVHIACQVDSDSFATERLGRSHLCVEHDEGRRCRSCDSTSIFTHNVMVVVELLAPKQCSHSMKLHGNEEACVRCLAPPDRGLADLGHRNKCVAPAAEPLKPREAA